MLFCCSDIAFNVGCEMTKSLLVGVSLYWLSQVASSEGEFGSVELKEI